MDDNKNNNKKRENEEENVLFGTPPSDGVIDAIPLFAKELIAGGVAKTIVAPLERVKILFQGKGSKRPRFGEDVHLRPLHLIAKIHKLSVRTKRKSI